jgi:hypothetical protein
MYPNYFSLFFIPVLLVCLAANLVVLSEIDDLMYGKILQWQTSDTLITLSDGFHPDAIQVIQQEVYELEHSLMALDSNFYVRWSQESISKFEMAKEVLSEKIRERQELLESLSDFPVIMIGAKGTSFEGDQVYLRSSSGRE